MKETILPETKEEIFEGETVLLCEDSLEGVLSAIYDAYLWKCDPGSTLLQLGEEGNLRLLAVYKKITPDPVKTVKVARKICRDFGEEAYEAICQALSTTDPEKANACYHVVALGLSGQNPKYVLGQMANPYVMKLYELKRRAWNEIHHLYGFLRFEELEQGILFARIGPSCNIITFLAAHFADRLPLENFVIYDEVIGFFVVHPGEKQWFLAMGEQLDVLFDLRQTEEEKLYQELFRHFCHKIAIEERRNPKLQKSFCPLRFQKYMTEF